jgi:hypothetical protein
LRDPPAAAEAAEQAGEEGRSRPGVRHAEHDDAGRGAAPTPPQRVHQHAHLLVTRLRQPEAERDPADAPVDLGYRHRPVVEERQRRDDPAVDARRGEGHASRMPVNLLRACAGFVPLLRKQQSVTCVSPGVRPGRRAEADRGALKRGAV